MSIEIHINKAVFFLFKKLEIVAHEVRFLLVTITHIFTASTLFSAHVENARASNNLPNPCTQWSNKVSHDNNSYVQLQRAQRKLNSKIDTTWLFVDNIHKAAYYPELQSMVRMFVKQARRVSNCYYSGYSRVYFHRPSSLCGNLEHTRSDNLCKTYYTRLLTVFIH